VAWVCREDPQACEAVAASTLNSVTLEKMGQRYREPVKVAWNEVHRALLPQLLSGELNAAEIDCSGPTIEQPTSQDILTEWMPHFIVKTVACALSSSVSGETSSVEEK